MNADNIPPETWTATPALFAQYSSRFRWLAFEYLLKLSDALIKVSTGEISHLMIFMPPRHGKSMLTSQHFPAWFIGHNPDKRVILASYEADFAASWGYKARNLLIEHGPLFNVKVSPASAARNHWDIEGHTGGMDTAGVGGPITGKGCQLLIIDDPVKNDEQANSKTYRDKTVEWYKSTAYTRIEPGGAVVLIMTRWHEDDLAGRLLKEEPNKWTVINFPAIAEEDDPLGREVGEPLSPRRYDKDALDDIKNTLGPYWWNSLYQQHPRPLEGAIFKQQHFKYYNTLPSLKVVFQTCDPAASTKDTADYFVLGTWGQTADNDLYLIDLIRTRLEGPDQINLFKSQYIKWNPAFQGVEIAGMGKLLYQMLVKEGLPIRELKPDKDKVTRALPAAARMEAGTIYFPAGAPWLGDFENELLTFPTGAHDDQCLIEGTLISTDRGLVPIEQLNNTYRVLTRKGYKEIEWCGVTSEQADVMTIVLDNGKSLTATRYHPIYVIGKGFIPMDAITYGDQLLSEHLIKKKSSTTAQFTEDIQVQKRRTTEATIPQTVLPDTTDLRICTGKYGNHTTEKSPKDMPSTTKMATRLTIPLKISYVFQQVNTPEYTCMRTWKTPSTLKECENTSMKYAHSQKLGIVQKKEETGILSKPCKTTAIEHRLKKHVNSAALNSMTCHVETIPDSAQISVMQSGGATSVLMTKPEFVKCVDLNSKSTDILKSFVVPAVVELNMDTKKRKVYNLSVKDEHEYFANGVLVHNCDVLSYAVQMSMKKEHKVPRFSGGFGISGGGLRI